MPTERELIAYELELRIKSSLPAELQSKQAVIDSDLIDLAEPSIPIPALWPGSLPQSMVDALDDWSGAELNNILEGV